MPGRKIPPEIMAYLEACLEPDSPAEIIVEQCGLGKLMKNAGLTDYDPLVAVMALVAEEVRGLGLSLKPGDKGRKVWCKAMRMIQDGDGSLEHNTFLPCRTCDQAFEPVIDNHLLTLFLTWSTSDKPEDLIAMHKCPSCKGQIVAKRTKTYQGDMHTPDPGSVNCDAEWAELLFQHARK